MKHKERAYTKRNTKSNIDPKEGQKVRTQRITSERPNEGEEREEVKMW